VTDVRTLPSTSPPDKALLDPSLCAGRPNRLRSAVVRTTGGSACWHAAPEHAANRDDLGCCAGFRRSTRARTPGHLFEVVEAEPLGHRVEAHAVRSVTRLSLITVGRT